MLFQSVFKLACGVSTVVGPFGAGMVPRYVANPEACMFFMCAGVLLGIAGLFGFAGVERAEQKAHDRARLGRRL